MSSDVGETRSLAVSSRQTVIELVGTPGAGKTTVAAEVLATCRERGLTAATIVEAARPHAARTVPGRLVASLAPARLRGPLLWQVFYGYGVLGAAGFAVARSELARTVVRSERTRPVPAALKRHTLFWFFQLAGRRRFLAKRPVPGEVLVVDDGFLHRAVALHASPGVAPDLGAVGRYVERIPQPDLVVAVHADPARCIDRIRDRGLWRHRRGWSDADLSSYVRHADQVVEAAVTRARELGWTVVSVDNDVDGLDRPRAEVRAALVPFLPEVPA